jgi:3-keto-5-aminohexanoate cleavage enzyme
VDKLIITAAICGAEVTRAQTPYLPLTPEELAEASRECRDAGAAMVHLHVRDVAGNPTQSGDVFTDAVTRIRARTDIIVQASTGGAVWMTPDQRLDSLRCRPEMATLTCGTVNFGDEVFQNDAPTIRTFAKRQAELGVRPEFEIFDAGHLAMAERLVSEGLVTGHLHYDFVLGVPGALPASVENLVFLSRQLPKGATWTVAGMGRHQLPMAAAAIVMGGNVRVGFEDNIYYAKGVLATSNAQLVERVVRLARELGREVATPDEARALLGLRHEAR